MEERILRNCTIGIVLLGIVSCFLIFHFPTINSVSDELICAWKNNLQKSEAERLNMTGLELLEYNNVQAKKKEETDVEVAFDSQLRLELPLGVSGDQLKVSQDYVTRTIDITIPYADEEYFYDYPMLGKSDHIDELFYEHRQGYGIVEFVTSEVVELKTHYDEDYFYVDFLTPQELYDKVVVIDAGHGGSTPGATKQGIFEKDIDLAIVLELKKIFDQDKEHNIGVYYTRVEDTNPTYENRVELANKSNANLFISIHNNSTASGRMSNINGTQVMFDEKKAEEEHGTKRLAQICLEEVVQQTGSSDKGLVYGNEIYIIRESKVPVALIEVGFMTNQRELDLLCTRDYQQKVAQGIYNAVLRAFEEGY